VTSTIFALALSLAVASAGCGDDQAPERARSLHAEVLAADYQSWESPADFATRQPSHTAHREEVRIFFNGVMAMHHQGAEDCAASDPGTGERFVIEAGVEAWPDGSIIVKEGFDGGSLDLLAIMKKEGGEWFYAEYDGDGETLYSGTPELCTDCHDGARHDGVFSANLDRLCSP